MQPPEAPPIVAQTIDPGRTTRRRLLVAAVLLLLIIYLFRSPDEIKHPPGVLIPEEPYQTDTDRTSSWEFKGEKFTPLANIRFRARVLHTERYWIDQPSRFSPIDLAVGWGPMSDQRVIEQFKFSQGRRWYFWQFGGKERPLTDRQVALYSANMHIIPSTQDIDKRLREVRAGHIVYITGQLVLVESKDGWRWRSSLSRTDVGFGACEIIWVTDLSVR